MAQVDLSPPAATAAAATVAAVRAAVGLHVAQVHVKPDLVFRANRGGFDVYLSTVRICSVAVYDGLVLVTSFASDGNPGRTLGFGSPANRADLITSAVLDAVYQVAA